MKNFRHSKEWQFGFCYCITLKPNEMKKVFLLIHLLCTVCIAVAQINTDSTKRKLLKSILDSARDDSTRFKLIDSVWVYIYSNPDSALKYIQQNILLSQKMKSDVALSISYGQYGALEQINGNYPGGLLYRIQSLRAAERTNNFILIAGAYNALGDVYKETGDFKKAITNIKKAKSLYEAHWKPTFEPDVDHNTVYTYFQILRKLAETYEHFNHPDSAMNYANYLYDAYIKVNGKMNSPALLFVMGNIYSKLGGYAKALDFYRSGAEIAINTDIKSEVMENYSGMAKVFKTTGEIDSSIHYGKKVLEVSKVARNIIVKMEALNLLADAFKLKHNNDSVAKYLDLTIVTKDSLFSQQKIMRLS